MNEQTNIQVKSALPEGISFVEIRNFGRFAFLLKLKNLLKFIGPAFIVSVAYIDPAILVLEHRDAAVI